MPLEMPIFRNEWTTRPPQSSDGSFHKVHSFSHKGHLEGHYAGSTMLTIVEYLKCVIFCFVFLQKAVYLICCLRCCHGNSY